ncbi:hypothetical protein AWB67_06937 [Caballeronia terrestris]|uniref:Uncharacterized protein n=1 Tax=Caballeronia terrestris TaxID=1226301 RepID=A0A158KXF3_9BURK|nr:hypothetical protein [Caballeronia terrestris]SAL85419.1 hypothetical protein AWB67_06937 [Caballeronia terrestris]
MAVGAPAKDLASLPATGRVVDRVGLSPSVVALDPLRSSSSDAQGSLQRQPANEDQRAKIAKAIHSGQFLDVADIDNLSQANDEEKVALSQICISGGYVAPQDATAKVFSLWSSMGDRLPGVASAHLNDWDGATHFSPSLMTLAPVKDVQDAFQAAVRAVAEANLNANEDFVEQRKKRFASTGDPSANIGQQADLRHAVQGIAWHAWELRQQQARLGQIEVGYESQNLGFGDAAVKFNPARRPRFGRTLFSTPRAKWEDLKPVWDDTENELTRIGNEYPEVYEAGIGDGSALLNLSRVTPEHFNEQALRQLDALKKRIGDVRSLIEDGSLNLLELGVLDQAVLSGTQRPPGRAWTGQFEHWGASRLVEQHKADKAQLPAMLKVIEVTALVLGTFAGGIGRFVAAGVAVGIEAFQAGQAAGEAGPLEKASSVTPLTGSGLVSRAQADEKKSEMVARMVEAIINALMLGGAAIAEGFNAIRLRVLVTDPALLARLRQMVADENLLIDLLKKAGNPTALEALLEKVPAARLGTLLDSVGNPQLLRELLEECPDVDRLSRLTGYVPEPTQLKQLLSAISKDDLDKLERVLRQIAQPGAGSFVLEVGAELEAATDSVIINPGRKTMSVARLRELKPDNLVIATGAESIPLPDGCARLIKGQRLPNSIDWDTAASQFKRVLAPGGQISIVVYGPPARLHSSLVREGFRVISPADSPLVEAIKP